MQNVVSLHPENKLKIYDKMLTKRHRIHTQTFTATSVCLNLRLKDALVFLANAFFLYGNRIKELN